MWQKRFGRYTFRIYRSYRGHAMLRSPTPFQQRLRRLFPSLRPRLWPMDARHLGTFALPFPRGEIDLDIYRHKENRPAR